jgi:hypothetical protein
MPDFNQIWIFSTDFHRSPQYQISRKFVQWEPLCYMRTDRRKDRRKDMTKVISVLPDYADMPKNDNNNK